MIRRMALACLIGLMPSITVAQGSDEPLVTVETLPPEPTVLMSGDVVTITYRVRFPDLADTGKEIIVLEDRMAPGALSVHPFEGLAMQVDKRAVPGGHVWDFTYGLRLIHRDKASYTIPPISVFWLLRDFGEAIENAEVEQVETAAAPVQYVTTITESGPLDIRDAIELGRHATAATVWTAVAWILSPLPLLLWVLYVGALSRRSTAVAVNARGDEDKEHLEMLAPAAPTAGAARRHLRRTVARLKELGSAADAAESRRLERDLVISIRDYLQAELPALNSGDTAKEIGVHVETRVPPGAGGEALRALASRLVVYQRRLEQGAQDSSIDALDDARLIDEALDQLRPHVRLWHRVREVLLGRGGAPPAK